MRDMIISKLKAIEKSENVRILLAVESGSRAWGFPSPDSDYDVRFIYARNVRDYLRLEPVKDVIELPVDAVLDINGWDLRKSLLLLHKSNPTLFEWFSSPLVYMETGFADEFRSIMGKYFSSKKGLYHYISMASGNFREYLKTDMVRGKKYFYVLRPVLACRWILDKGTPPPMLFDELAESELPYELKDIVGSLLKLKTASPELKMIPKIPTLNSYLENSIAQIKSEVEKIPDAPETDFDELNRLFIGTVNGL